MKRLFTVILIILLGAGLHGGYQYIIESTQPPPQSDEENDSDPEPLDTPRTETIKEIPDSNTIKKLKIEVDTISKECKPLIKLCGNCKDLSGRLLTKIDEFYGFIDEVVDSSNNDIKASIRDAKKLFSSDTAKIEIAVDKKTPDVVISLSVENYFYRLMDTTFDYKVEVEEVEKVIISEIRCNKETGECKGVARIKQIYKRYNKGDGLDGMNVLLYEDTTYKKATFHIVPIDNIDGEGKGCDILIESIKVISIE